MTTVRRLTVLLVWVFVIVLAAPRTGGSAAESVPSDPASDATPASTVGVSPVEFAGSFVYEAPVDVERSATVEPAGFAAATLGLGGSASSAGGDFWHVYDSSRSLVAPNSARIFRAVEPDELADIQRSGQFGTGEPNAAWLDGKYFWLTEEHADAYVDLATKSDFGGPYCVTSGCIPSDVLRQIEVVTMDGNPAVFIPEDLLPLIDDILVLGG